MRVLVCGGRDFSDAPLIYRTLADLLLEHILGGGEPEDFWIIHGAAPGADTIAGQWAEMQQIQTDVYPADWKKHGKAAGPIRNQQMLRLGMPDLVVAFAGGRGTADMTDRATAAGVRVLRVALATSTSEKQSVDPRPSQEGSGKP